MLLTRRGPSRAFSVIVKSDGSFAALVLCYKYLNPLIYAAATHDELLAGAAPAPVLVRGGDGEVGHVGVVVEVVHPLPHRGRRHLQTWF